MPSVTIGKVNANDWLPGFALGTGVYLAGLWLAPTDRVHLSTAALLAGVAAVLGWKYILTNHSNHIFSARDWLLTAGGLCFLGAASALFHFRLAQRPEGMATLFLTVGMGGWMSWIGFRLPSGVAPSRLKSRLGKARR